MSNEKELLNKDLDNLNIKKQEAKVAKDIVLKKKIAIDEDNL